MQGKLVSFVPLMKAGVHDTYQGKNGVLYKFTQTWLLDDGTHIIGTANSNKPQPTWKLNTLLTFDDKETEYNGQKYHNFSNIKDPAQQSNFTGGGSKPNPSFIIQKCFEGAVECTLAFFELNQEYYKDQSVEDKLLTAVYEHILGPVGTSESRRWINLSAMRLAIAKMRSNGLFDKDKYKTLSEWLFANASSIADTMEKVVKDTVEKESKPQ